MTVKELRQKLEDVPDLMDVMFTQTNDEYRFSLVETAEVREVTFRDGILKSIDNCFVLTDEI